MEYPRNLPISQKDREDRERDYLDQEKREQEESLRKRLNLPPRFSKCTLNNFDPMMQITAEKSAKDYIEKYDKKTSKGLYFYGHAGSGKTHLVASIGNALIEKARPRFVSVPELLLRLKKGFSDNHDEYLDTISYTQLLILDDIGSEKPTEWVQEILFVIIDRRYTNFLPTLFTSNLSLDQLKDRLGRRIASRIAEMSEVVELRPSDYRIRKNKDEESKIKESG